LPSSSHGAFSSLHREQRLAIMKMAALLRVADALDTRHSASFPELSLEKNDEELIVHSMHVKDFSAERHSLKLKSNLFEEVYGLKIILER
jgi:exopolyphosphatase/guanosine-5'-triphosphate,3'-diphosphate pyrophosphatase